MPTENPEWRKSRCEHCRAGNTRIDHSSYGLRHILVNGESWAESEHVPCTAPSSEAYIAELESDNERLCRMLDETDARSTAYASERDEARAALERESIINGRLEASSCEVRASWIAEIASRQCAERRTIKARAALRLAVGALKRNRQGYLNILDRKLVWDQNDGYGARYGALTREEIDGVIAEVDTALSAPAVAAEAARLKAQGEREKRLVNALEGLTELVELWMSGPLLSHINWISLPPALIKARAALEAK